MAWELINMNPFKDIEKVRSELDKLWDTFLFGRPQKGDFQGEGEWQPPIDVAETESELVVNVEIPGMDPKDIDISLSEGTLTIRGERKQEKENEEEDYHFIERNYGPFSRSIQIRREIESNNISASYKNGVLRITLPKSHEARKEIKIKVQ
jgi:HSP20 family protein